MWTLGRYDEALEAFNEVIKLSPEYPGAYRRVAGVLLAMDEGQQALAAAQKELDAGYRLTAVSEAHDHLGNTAESDAALQKLIDNHGEHMAAQIAEAYAYQGKVEETFMWLERGYESRDPGIVVLLSIDRYQILHDDPRWIAFLEKVQLADAWRAMSPEFGGPQ